MRDEMTQEELRMVAAKQAAEVAYHQQPQIMNQASERQSARGAIEQRCENLLREANGLRALLRALPQDMSQAAEEALWKLAVGR